MQHRTTIAALVCALCAAAFTPAAAGTDSAQPSLTARTDVFAPLSAQPRSALERRYLRLTRRVAAERAGRPGRNLSAGVPTPAGGWRRPTTIELERAVRRLRGALRAARQKREARRRAAAARAATATRSGSAAGAPSVPGSGAVTSAAPTGGALQTIAQCESGGDPTAVGGGGQYRGKYQFSYATWQSVGGQGDPAAASEAEQDQRAALLLAREGAGHWPNCG